MQQPARWHGVRFIVTLLLVGLFGLFSHGTTSQGNVPGIPWDATTPLTWDLFRCAPPADAVNRSEAAAIHMTVRWHASYSVTSRGAAWTGRVQTVTVSNTMEPSLSWVVSGKANAHVLRHEQGHFDLNEVYRRKLELHLTCLQAESASKQGAIDALNTALHQRANEILAQLQAAQARYDAEAGHGNDPTGQAQWEARIAAWLLNPSAAP